MLLKVILKLFFSFQTSPEGYCFVQFSDNNAACQSMTFLNGRDFCGKVCIRLSFC